MTKLYILVAVVAVASGVLVTGACMTRAEDPQPFLIVWSYDTSGYLETCGCSAHQRGGLARRAAKIDALREKQPVLAIEGAHFVEDAGEFQLFKGETVIRALNMVGYDAVMLGLREAQHGKEGLARLATLSDAPCFSANLHVTGGAAWVSNCVLVDIAGTSIAITGVSQPEAASFDLPPDVRFDDPREALDTVIADAGLSAEIAVLCLEGEDTWIRDMARDYSGSFDLFLSGNRSPVTADLNYSPQPPRLNNWQLGKHLGIVAVDPAGDSTVFAGMNVPLEEELEESAEIAAMLDRDFRAHLKEKFFSRMKADLEQLFLPPSSCEPCHAEAFAAYDSSRHARALDTLVDLGQAYNPDCMSCHLVYDSGQDELQPINCIVCHSNITEQHLWDAVEGNVPVPEQPVTSYSFEFCVTCHNELNSLPFEEHWPQYVNRVYHGGDDTAAREAAEELGLDYTASPPDVSSH